MREERDKCGRIIRQIVRQTREKSEKGEEEEEEGEEDILENLEKRCICVICCNPIQESVIDLSLR